MSDLDVSPTALALLLWLLWPPIMLAAWLVAAALGRIADALFPEVP